MEYDVVEDGFAVVANVVSAPQQREVLAALSASLGSAALGLVAGAGRRGVLSMPAVAALARSEGLLRLVRPFLNGPGDDPGTIQAVRAIYFDKSPDANWLVAWHQDLTLAVRERIETPGFGAWSIKQGVHHVQPPVEYLARMLAVRVHLDPADAANGALRVIPGSHQAGRLSAAQVQGLRAKRAEVVCHAAAGDVLLMRPLLLHASGRSASPGHRRVLHLEYAGFELPGGLKWHEAG